MPILPNTRHEAFCDEISGGATVDQAYARSGLVQRHFDAPVGFYVYLLIDPRDQTLFYVGKGSKRRAHAHWYLHRKGVFQTNREKAKRLADIDAADLVPRVDILCDGLGEGDALNLESAVIRRIGFKRLTNRLAPATFDERVADANLMVLSSVEIEVLKALISNDRRRMVNAAFVASKMLDMVEENNRQVAQCQH